MSAIRRDGGRKLHCRVPAPFVETHRVAQIDCPLLYVYAVTGKNTWSAPHFETMLAAAECTFEQDQFDELNELLSNRVPLLDYSAMLTAKDAIRMSP